MPIGPFAEIPATSPPQKIRLEHINELRRALSGLADAYDVAVAEGFTGTRGEWLASLQGPPGAGVVPLGSVADVASLPSAGNDVDDVYTVDADGHAYAWDGSAWVDIGAFRGPGGEDTDLRARVDPGTAGAAGQALEHTLAGALAWQYPSRKAVNIRNHGAVEGADIHAALAAAKADAALYKQPIYIPTGDWRLSSLGAYGDGVTLTAAGAAIVGDGPGSRIQVAAGAPVGTRLIVLSGARQSVEGIALDLLDPVAGTTIADGVGIQPLNATDVRIAYIWADNPASGGINVGDGVTGLSVDRYTARGGGYGILTQDITTGGEWSFTNLDLDGQGEGGDGLEVNCPTNGVSGVEVLHVRARNYAVGGGGNAGFGVGMANVHNFVVSDVRGGNCGRNLVHIEDASSNGVVSQVNAVGCGNGGVEVQAGAPVGGVNRGCKQIDIHHVHAQGCCTSPPVGGGVNVGKGAIEVANVDQQDHINVRHCMAWDSGQAGIYYQLVHRGNIEHNQCWDNATHGIYVYDHWDATIRSNDTYGNATAGIGTGGHCLNLLVDDNYNADTTPRTMGWATAGTLGTNR